ncbi:39S ribosomal protein L32, mitochondrial [Habropoda laboriosa]|uniref:Large ribosomal subunit protein bL32m n=1 Tax=Habropoda laboriosa TaxID=597456 RepID=A0A0L7QLW3_9HYME|nr:PREDICTED: 39S ribosomal protein L32, mitochondrial [Habropoda laboriosa]KOC59496.1 39S ribosomal protein L32, mitochondrial [Habropoda laboriosa]
MANSVFSRLYRAFQTFDQAIDIILGRSLPPGNLCAIGCNAINQVQPKTFPAQSLKDILNDAFLWAVPKKRRSLEKRLCRRFGIPELHWKPPVPKTNILMCRKCGHNHEANTLCGYCYEIVKKETQIMQEAIKKSLGLKPIEQDVIVLYEGEKEELQDKFWKNQRIVELPKKRPEWFHQNLLQPTTQDSADLQDEKPEDSSSINIKND